MDDEIIQTCSLFIVVCGVVVGGGGVRPPTYHFCGLRLELRLSLL